MNIFADSSLLVEYIKNTKTDLLEFLIGMKKHNLLPNDASILATCLHHKMPYLSSYDVTDFATACSSEGITLISNAEGTQQHLS